MQRTLIIGLAALVALLALIGVSLGILNWIGYGQDEEKKPDISACDPGDCDRITFTLPPGVKFLKQSTGVEGRVNITVEIKNKGDEKAEGFRAEFRYCEKDEKRCEKDEEFKSLTGVNWFTCTNCENITLEPGFSMPLFAYLNTAYQEFGETKYLDAGEYVIKVILDPPTPGNPSGLVDEKNERNNEITTFDDPPHLFIFSRWLEWLYPEEENLGPIRSSPAIYEERGETKRIYFGSDDGHLYAIGPDSKLIWSFPEEGKIKAVRSSPTVDKDTGKVYFGSDDGNLYALDRNGNLKWKFETDGPIRTKPAIGKEDGKTIVYFGSNDGHLYAIEDEEDEADEKWKFPKPGKIGAVRSNPAVAVVRIDTEEVRIIYVGSDDGNLYAIDAENGKELWGFPAGGPVRSSPTVKDWPTIYIGSGDGNLYAIKDLYPIEDYEEKWNVLMGGPVSSPLYFARIYVGSSDGNLYERDREDGKEIWKFRTDGPIESKPAVMSDTVFLGSNDGNLYGVGLEHGLLKEGFPAPTYGPVTITPIVKIRLEKDKYKVIIYFGSDDGHLYKLKVDEEVLIGEG